MQQLQYQGYPDEERSSDARAAQAGNVSATGVVELAAAATAADPKPVRPYRVVSVVIEADSEDESDVAAFRQVLVEPSLRLSLQQDMEFIGAALEVFYDVTSSVLQEHADHYRVELMKQAQQLQSATPTQHRSSSSPRQSLSTSSSLDQQQTGAQQPYVYVPAWQPQPYYAPSDFQPYAQPFFGAAGGPGSSHTAIAGSAQPRSEEL